MREIICMSLFFFFLYYCYVGKGEWSFSQSVWFLIGCMAWWAELFVWDALTEDASDVSRHCKWNAFPPPGMPVLDMPRVLNTLFCCCCCCCFWTTLDYYCCRHYCQDGAYGPCCGKRAIGRLWETDLRGSQREKKLFRKQIFLKSLKLKFIHDLYKWLNWVFWFCLPVVYPHLHLLSFLRILTVRRLNTPKVFCSETPEVFHFF